MLRRCLSLGCLCLGLTAVVPRAHASFIWFTLNGGPGQQVVVAEQIVCITAGHCGVGDPARSLDYQFYVFNTGAFAMDGFSVGAGNRAVAIAGGENYSNLAGGADGVFPAATGGGVTNAIGFLAQPVVNPPLVTSRPPGQGVTAFQTAGPNSVDLSPAAGGGWGFEEFDNFSAGQAPAQKSYMTRWYTAAQGGAGRANLYNNGCNGNTPTANGAGQPINSNSGVLNAPLNCAGSVWYAMMRVDLFSPNNPVPGTGAPDPFASGFDLGFDDIVNGIDVSVLDTSQGPVTDICDPSVTTCSTISSGFDPSSQVQIAPEPSALLLIGGGLIGLAALRRWRS
jgi:hypothetical protein